MNQIPRPAPDKCPNLERLADYRLGKLEVVQREQVVRHLKACAACQATVNSLNLQADPTVTGPGLQQTVASATKRPLVPVAASAAAFDAYHEWLGISPAEQPPNHYRLLGLANFETNVKAIQNAADRQMAYVRKLQAGEHAAEANKTLNAISQARICLLNGERKAKYDAQLREQIAGPNAAATPAVAPLPWPDGQNMDSAETRLQPPIPSLYGTGAEVNLPTTSPSPHLLGPHGASFAPAPAARSIAPPHDRKKTLQTRILIAVGATFSFFLIAAAVVTLASKPRTGDLEVVLENGIGRDVRVEVSASGTQTMVLDEADGWKKSLPAGEYQVALARGADDLELSKSSVTITRDKTQTVNVTRKRPSPPPAVSQKPGWMDLLAAMDTAKHAVKGRWKRNGTDVLAVQLGSNHRAYSPIEIKGSYDLECEFTFNDKTQAGLILPVGNSAVVLNLGLNGGTDSRLEVGSGVDAIHVRPQPLVPNRRMKVNGSVRVNSAENLVEIRLEVTGHPSLSYRGTTSAIRFPQNSAWSLPFQRRLALTSHDTLVTFHTLRVKLNQPNLPPVDDAIYPIRGDTLEPEKWHDALAAVDVEKHAFGGIWKRTADGVSNLTKTPGKMVVPIQIQGDYELRFAFTRTAFDDWIAFHLPIGKANQCDLAFSCWRGKVHCLSAVSKNWAEAEPKGATSVVRPGKLENHRRYNGVARVVHDGEEVEVTVTLDDRPLFSWKGAQANVRPLQMNAFPRADLLGFAHWSQSQFVVHEFAVKPLRQKASVWNPTEPQPASSPPVELKDEIAEWNGNRYWLSSQTMPYTEAIALAQRHNARLLEISSKAEMQFVQRQFPNQNLWLNAWRSDHTPDPRKGWKNSRLEPIANIPFLGIDQPWAGGNKIYLSFIRDNGGVVRDVPDDWRASFACLEWGEERSAPTDTPIVITPLKSPPEFRLATNGLGGVQYVDPLAWNRDWIQSGEFAHIRGPGQLVFPELKSNSFALDFDFTCNAPKGEVVLELGDRGDAHILMPLKVGFEEKNPSEVRYRLWNWVNQVRWISGNAAVVTTKGMRNNTTLVIRESEMAILRDGQKVHGLATELVDPVLRLRSDSGTADIVIHRCQLRPLTEADCLAARIKPPPPAATADVAKSKERWSRLVAELPEQPTSGKDFVVGGTQTPMNWVAPGDFKMGRHEDKGARLHGVTLSKGFWMSRTEITQREWKALMPSNPSRMTGSDYLPVDSVAYAEASEFCRRLTAEAKKLGQLPPHGEYRLPTEAEWEYACRAGRAGSFPTADEQNWATTYGSWVPQEVAIQKSNPWGFFDMTGNTTEWCLDGWHDYPATDDVLQSDPFTPPTDYRHRRIVRGGTGWRNADNIASERTSHYDVCGGFRGFRIVLGSKLTDKISPLAFDPFANVEPPDLVPLRTALPVPPAGQRLEAGKWYDLLATIDVDKHVINGLWQRRKDGIHAYLPTMGCSRLVPPVQIQGDYELVYRFQQIGRPEQINLGMPVGQDACCNFSIGEWGNRVSGIHFISGVDSLRRVGKGTDTSSRVPVPRKIHTANLKVMSAMEKATVEMRLDDELLTTWHGPRNALAIHSEWIAPRPAMFCLGVHSNLAVIHDMHLKMITGSAERITPQNASALEPPDAIKRECVKWNDRYYWISPGKSNIGNAIALAAKHNARLLTISSDEERLFLRRTWSQKELWLGAWRNINDPNPKTGWIDHNLQPLKYFGQWGENQPEGHETFLCIKGADHLWHDSPPGTSFHTVLEWGDEQGSAIGQSATRTSATATVPASQAAAVSVSPPSPPRPSLLQLPRRFKLPEIATESVASTTLAPLALNGMRCLASLHGGDIAARTPCQFRLEGDVNDLSAWNVVISKKEGVTPIARLTVQDNLLKFGWTPQAADNPNSPYLANCLLQFAVGAESRTVALRAPMLMAPILLDADKPLPTRVACEHLPASATLTLELLDHSNGPRTISPEVFGAVKVGAINDTRWLSSSQAKDVLGLRMEASATAKEFSFKTYFFMRLGGLLVKDKGEPYTMKTFTAKQKGLEAHIQYLRQQHTALSSSLYPKDPTAAEQRTAALRSSEERLKQAYVAALPRFQAVQSLVESLQSPANALHLRLVHNTPAGKVVLIETRP